jgi:hypothetical protein
MMFSLRIAAEIGLGLMMMRPPRQALADVVVTFAGQFQRHALGQEGTEGLAGRAGQLDVDGVIRQTGIAVAAGNFAREHGAAGTVDVDDRGLDLDLLALFERRLGLLDQLVIERLVQAVILNFGVAARTSAGTLAGRRSWRNPVPWPSSVRYRAHIEQVGARPTRSSNLRMPSCAMISRTSSATKKK